MLGEECSSFLLGWAVRAGCILRDLGCFDAYKRLYAAKFLAFVGQKEKNGEI